ncbi:MAG: hypothetical protein K2V38_28460 [Gemmataceae bacterium]|nr:hypothetical protein [Gemmataceae bacterium]
MIVVKVGGSLFDHPALGPTLREYLESLRPAEVLLVVGGGAVADAVRDLDRLHGLGEESAHWVALRSLGVTAAFVERLLGGGALLDAHAFALADEARPGALPHSWDVTTDSIAARVAGVYCAERLVLLKSRDIPPGTPWTVASREGWVDAHFPHVAQTLGCPVEVVNFRRLMDART